MYEEVVADTHTVPFNEKVNWLPFDAVVATEPVTGLPAPGPHGGGGVAATCEPLVVPRNIGVPKTWPTVVVTSCTVDVIVPHLFRRKALLSIHLESLTRNLRRW